jgi:ferredoxin, 2Fe-2S
MPKVTYIENEGSSRTLDVDVGENVMRGAVYNGVPGIAGDCGGGLSCATCHCYIDDAWVERVGGPSSSDEAELLQGAAAELRANSRLSCQIDLRDDLDGLIVHLPETQY